MIRLMLAVAVLLGTVGGSAPRVAARSVIFGLNVFPKTESWEVVARVAGEGQAQDGLAGYFYQLLVDFDSDRREVFV